MSKNENLIAVQLHHPAVQNSNGRDPHRKPGRVRSACKKIGRRISTCYTSLQQSRRGNRLLHVGTESVPIREMLCPSYEIGDTFLPSNLLTMVSRGDRRTFVYIERNYLW